MMGEGDPGLTMMPLAHLQARGAVILARNSSPTLEGVE